MNHLKLNNMKTLEEKFKEIIFSQTHVVTLQNENLAVSGINKASEQCAELTEQECIGFAEWKDLHCRVTTDSYNEFWCELDNYSQRRNNKELFQLYLKSKEND